MVITREFYDIKFELEEKVVNKFYDIQAKMIRGERFGDLSNGALEWKEFTEEFFQEQNLSYPNIFRTREDLKKLQIRVYGTEIKNQKTSVISCFGYYLEQWEFFFSMGFMGDFESVNFINANFHSHVSFQHMRVSGLACFDEVEFIETADFNYTRFSDKVSFSNAIFRDSSRFNYASFADSINFSNATFEKNVDFEEINFFKRVEEKGQLQSFKKSIFLNLEKACFKGDRTIFTQRDLVSNEEYIDLKLSGILTKNTLFKTVLILDLKFTECPDLSLAHFINKSSIVETWLEDSEEIRNIKSDDEPKFRFFKKYFSNEANHFRELEYFSYEMKAKERKLKDDVGCKKFLTRKWWGLGLFECYKFLSNYGLSITRPLVAMLFSFGCFAIIFQLYFDCDPRFAFANSLKRVFIPLSEFKCELVKVSAGLIAVLTLQTVINAALIFLLFLGVKNKFKIK